MLKVQLNLQDPCIAPKVKFFFDVHTVLWLHVLPINNFPVRIDIIAVGVSVFPSLQKRSNKTGLRCRGLEQGAVQTAIGQ